MKLQAPTLAMPDTAIDQRCSPIGLFDSGIGGLSVYKHLAKQLPNERYIYYADTKHVPYGDRSSDEIAILTLTAIEWLYHQGCKLIVIACNSASAYALEAARARYPALPIVGLVPALKPAVLASQNSSVAVLATKATLQGTLLNQVICEVAQPKGTHVIKCFDPTLVPWVEAGMPLSSPVATSLREQLEQFAKAGADYLVLGCTHYPFFKDYLLRIIDEHHLGIEVVDSGQAIASRVQCLLASAQQLALPACEALPLTFYASKADAGIYEVVRQLLGEQMSVQFVA